MPYPFHSRASNPRGEIRDRRCRVALFLTAAAILTTVVGCASEEAPRLVDHLEEMEFDVPLESAVDLPFGEFDVPVVVTVDSEHGTPASSWMRLQFKLWAQTTPDCKSELVKAYDHHRGALNDAIVTIVRTSNADELTDSRLAAIKNRMAEVARPLLGEDRLRQLVLTDIRTEAL